MKLKEHDMPASKCPHCGTRFDRASSLDDEAPGPGDVTVCIRCAKICIFNEDLTVRKPTGPELFRFTTDPRVMELQMFIADTAGRVEAKQNE